MHCSKIKINILRKNNNVNNIKRKHLDKVVLDLSVIFKLENTIKIFVIILKCLYV